MRRALFLALPLALAACDGPSIKINAKGGEGDNASVSLGNGTIAIKGDGADISLKVPDIDLGAGDFDVDGLKLYPGSKIREMNVDAQGKDGKVDVAFDAPAALPTVKAWFSEALAKNKFKVQPRGDGFEGATDEGKPFKLELSADGDQKARGRIEVGS